MDSLPSLKTTLSKSFDGLLSLQSSTTTITTALEELESFIITIGLNLENNPNFDLLHAFLVLQDGFEFNVTGRLLEFVGRTVVELKRVEEGREMEMILAHLGKSLEIIQGLLLLHRPSQRLFGRRATIEYLIFILDLLGSKAKESASAATGASSSGGSSSARVSLGVLNTILCALVDRPRNIRTFESVDGLKAVVKVLKDKKIAQIVRIKAIEILYYYLLPETINSIPYQSLTTTEGLPNLLENLSNEFIPQTPIKARFHHSRSNSRESLSRERGREERRSSSISSFESIREDCVPTTLFRGEEDEDGTPKAIKILPPQKSKSKSKSSSPSRSQSIPNSPTPSTRSNFSTTSHKSTRSTRSNRTDGGGGTIRKTELEKKELLRKVMGNVDSLEAKFKSMRLAGFGI